MKVPELLYYSPVVRYDPRAEVEIFERRDTTTGAVSFQEPGPEEIKHLEQGSVPSAAPPGARPRVSLIA